MDALREVRVTDFFLGLDQKTRGCQDNEQLLNCSTKKYLESVLNQCGCLPSNIKMSKEACHLVRY